MHRPKVVKKLRRRSTPFLESDLPTGTGPGLHYGFAARRRENATYCIPNSTPWASRPTYVSCRFFLSSCCVSSPRSVDNAGGVVWKKARSCNAYYRYYHCQCSGNRNFRLQKLLLHRLLGHSSFQLRHHRVRFLSTIHIYTSVFR